MAKKGKMKISKVKRNNLTTNKMRKSGQMRLQRHRPKVQKQKAPATPQIQYSDESDSASGDEWADMLDEDEQKYIMNRLVKDPKLLSSVPDKEDEAKPTKKRKRTRETSQKPDFSPDSGAESDNDGSNADSDIEAKYEKEQADRPTKRMRPLLPIKTKQGIMERSEECEDSPSESEEPMDTSTQDDSKQDSDSDSGMDGTEDEVTTEEKKEEGVVTAVQLLAARRDTLNKEKIRIGALCSSLIESPERKLKNLYPILYLMEERLKDGTPNLVSVRKIATLSACEVFKDVLPDYMLRHQDYTNVKLKKDTLSLYKYEKELLDFYKRYLQRLEKATSVLRRKKGDTRKPDESTLSLALISLRCLCGLLATKPNFNYAINIAQSVVPMLGCKEIEARQAVTESCVTCFQEDKKGEITLTLVRLINQLVRKRGERLHPSALDCLLSLKIRDVELDAEADVKHKQKQEEKHKKRIVNLSKKEKKRNKKLKEVEKELLETQAQESELAHKKQMTEVTKTVFHIYFRILKTSPHSKLLAAVLNGLAKFTHVINLDYYSELVSILARLLNDDVVGDREKILVVRTALAILAGAGDSLNVDPARFHAYLYENMLKVYSGKNISDISTIISCICEVMSRSRRVPALVLQACGKRLATAALQWPHNASLAALHALYNLALQNKPVSSLFEASYEEAIGSGRFDPFLPSPEHCNAASASLHELTTLARHYHPSVRSLANTLVSQQQTLPQEFVKMTPMKIFHDYDGSQMAFKPSIPPPKKQVPRKNNSSHNWVQTSLKDHCDAVEEATELNVDFRVVFRRVR